MRSLKSISSATFGCASAKRPHNGARWRTGEHPMARRPAIGFDATTTLTRSDFGLGYAVPAVSDEVGIRITTEALAPKNAR